MRRGLIAAAVAALALAVGATTVAQGSNSTTQAVSPDCRTAGVRSSIFMSLPPHSVRISCAGREYSSLERQQGHPGVRKPSSGQAQDQRRRRQCLTHRRPRPLPVRCCQPRGTRHVGLRWLE
jgi:hypothetical protein